MVEHQFVLFNYREKCYCIKQNYYQKLTIKNIVCNLPQNFPLALAVAEYISWCEGILHDATLLLAANIHTTTSGMVF